MRKSDWSDARIWLMFTLLGFLVPVIVGGVVRGALGEDINLRWIAGSGQFAVSGAALLMTTSYFVARPGSISRLPFTEWFMLISIAGLVAGVTLYTLATLKISGVDIDPEFYLIPSIVLFVLALVLAFIAVGKDKEREITEPDFMGRAIRAGRTRIDLDFDSTR